jgi:hypothetical protein
MRMHMRRFTRLTNAFSNKVKNHMHMVALYTEFYNGTRIHNTLRVTLAMEAGIADRLWTTEEIAKLIEAAPRSRAGRRHTASESRYDERGLD